MLKGSGRTIGEISWNENIAYDENGTPPQMFRPYVKRASLVPVSEPRIGLTGAFYCGNKQMDTVFFDLVPNSPELLRIGKKKSRRFSVLGIRTGFIRRG
jgi:hypothetical protein